METTSQDFRAHRNRESAGIASLARPARRAPSAEEPQVLHACADFVISAAMTDEMRSSAAMLTACRYAWRGYEVDRHMALARAPDEVTLAACKDRELFGTLTVRFGKRSRLRAEALYPLEIEAIRAQGLEVCEFTRLAVDPQHGTREALAALFHLAFVYAHDVYGCDEILIEVNPRHVAFYERMLGFRRAGPERACPRVAAPAVLLQLSCAYAAAQVRQHGAHRATGERSLYPYFLSPDEAALAASRARRISGAVLARGKRGIHGMPAGEKLAA